MRTRKTCCCCGNKSCKETEYRYSSTSGDCKICALGRTTINIIEFEEGAPSEPFSNQGDDPDGYWRNPEGHSENLYMGNICWHRGPEDWWGLYPTDECEWNKCWDEEDYATWFSNAGAGSDYGPPEVSFYQFDSPMGLLPWSPQVFKDWRDNWEGPLLPQGDCTMHCTPDNLDCHTLAFVGAIGKNYGKTNSLDEMPVCGSDIVTVPPPQEEWEGVRDWIKRGGKLIIMGESSGSPIEGVGCRTKMDFFSKSDSYFVENCEDPLTQPQNMNGEQVAEILREFALFCGQREEEDEPEEFFLFASEEPGPGNFINSFSEDEDTESAKSCCQRSRRPFVKRDSESDPLRSFSFNCSSSSGLIPKGNGEGIVGKCSGDGCTVIFKKNGKGAVVVIYDSNVWGVSSSQIPMEWWNQEANHPDNIELGLSAFELKRRACNNDFWKFMCEEFLQEEGYSPSGCGDEVYWNNMEDDKYGLEENPCLKTAACALPDGSCIETNVWDCFDQTILGQILPGVWYGSETIHPQGHGGQTCLHCAEIQHEALELGVCCSVDPEACEDRCCLSEWGFHPWNEDLMYQYECECLIHDEGTNIKEVKWTPLSEVENSNDPCTECYITGFCCTTGDEAEGVCTNDISEWACGNMGGFWGEADSECEEDPSTIPNISCGLRAPCCNIPDAELGHECVENTIESECVAVSGNWLGDTSNPNPDLTCEDCNVFGACCFDGSGCVDCNEGDCEGDCDDFGGDFYPNEHCGDPNPCLHARACCYGGTSTSNPPDDYDPEDSDCQQCITVRPYECEETYEGTPVDTTECINEGCITCEVDPNGEEEPCLEGPDGWEEPCWSPCLHAGCNNRGACCSQDEEFGCDCENVKGKECINYDTTRSSSRLPDFSKPLISPQGEPLRSLSSSGYMEGVNQCCPCMGCLDDCMRQVECGCACGYGDNCEDNIGSCDPRDTDGGTDGGPYQIDPANFRHDICQACREGQGETQNYPECCAICNDKKFGDMILSKNCKCAVTNEIIPHNFVTGATGATGSHCGFATEAECCAEKERISLLLLKCYRLRYTHHGCDGHGKDGCYTCEDLGRQHQGGWNAPCNPSEWNDTHWGRIKSCMERECKYKGDGGPDHGVTAGVKHTETCTGDVPGTGACCCGLRTECEGEGSHCFAWQNEDGSLARDTTQKECESFDNPYSDESCVYVGDGTSCTTGVHCDGSLTGACCWGYICEEDYTEVACNAEDGSVYGSGTWKGECSTCEGGCDNPGACCHTINEGTPYQEVSCTITDTQQGCQELWGTFYPEAVCGQLPGSGDGGCPEELWGACCVPWYNQFPPPPYNPDGLGELQARADRCQTCTGTTCQITESICDDLDGTYLGDFSTCSTYDSSTGSPECGLAAIACNCPDAVDGHAGFECPECIEAGCEGINNHCCCGGGFCAACWGWEV